MQSIDTLIMAFTGRVCFFFVLVSGCSPNLFSASPEALSVEKILEFNRQNPVLRQHFREQILRSHWEYDLRGRLVNRTFQRLNRPLDQSTDQYIDRFVLKLVERFHALKLDFERLQARKAGLPGRGDSVGIEGGTLRELVENVGDHAGELHKMLSFVFVSLDSKKKFKPEVSGASLQNGFRVELAFLEKQIREAEQEIVDYFIQPSGTVSFSRLQGDNMLINLYEARQMSRAMSRALRRTEGG
jgi:hypothetical protein